MTRQKFLIVVALLGLIHVQIHAQEQPPIEIYTAQDYLAENQNWAISQAEDKTIYIANNKGLLEFNGARWQLYNSPNNTNLRSVRVIDDRIYTGCYMEFGYWMRNNFGTLTYTSLSQKLNTPLIEDEDFWNIIDLDNWVLFQSLDRIYIYSTTEDSFDILDSETTITKMFKANGTLFYQKINDGVYKIENGNEVLVSDDPVFQTNFIVNIFFHDRQFLIQTQDKGFFILYEDTIAPWKINADESLSNVSVYNSIQMKNGGFAIGTISDGIYQIDHDGNLVFHVNQSTGLSNNTVLSLFEDFDEELWLGLDNGINCFNINSPFKLHRDDKGILGSVYASIIHKDNLYLGTNQGLFYRPLNSKGEFNFIEGTQGQVWCLVEVKEALFCGHNFGTFLIDKNKAEKISNIQGTWDIKPIDGSPNLLLQGNYDGLNVLEKINGSWQFRNKIEGFDSSSRFFEFLNTEEVFVSHEYKGIFKIKLDPELKKAIRINVDSIKNGLNSSLIKYNNELLYTYSEGIFKYDRQKQEFLKDSTLSKLFNKKTFITGKLVPIEKEKKLWGFSKNAIHEITPGKLSNEPKINTISLPHSLRNSVISYENISHLYDQNYLLGTSSGYIIIDLNKIHNKSYSIALNTIRVSDMNNEFEYVDKTEEPLFKNKNNNIEFTYSVAEFDKYLNPEYQHQLLGFNDNWSDWSNKTSTVYNNLPFGSYTFKVRAKVGENDFTESVAYNFEVQRPWTLSNIMIIVYILVLLIVSFLTHNLYKRYYRKQRESLLLKSQKELELEKLKSEQQLMLFKNESLELDIESKNRELAISTMSLIKKNEFLNDIKKELNNAENEQNIKSVVKIIDKNLNNTEDWKMFEQAFNNADKDFLKKIKSEHSSLTPNDLKLCAYLRLNLSSKEIAPLLNISHRSVEVKRYRLRKKMNLPHKASLTHYILEI